MRTLRSMMFCAAVDLFGCSDAPDSANSTDGHDADVGADVALTQHVLPEIDPTERPPELVGGSVTFSKIGVGFLSVGCTATLIASNVFATAAHCVGFGTRSDARPLNLSVTLLRTSRLRYSVRVLAYRSYGTAGGASDVALLRTEPVPASVASPEVLGSALPGRGQPVTLYGYGCTRRATTCPSQSSPPTDGYKRMLATTWGSSSALCPGDSGGPVFFGGALVAVNSGYQCAGRRTDFFGLVAPLRAALNRQIRAWGQ